jgi:hypothetical protein
MAVVMMPLTVPAASLSASTDISYQCVVAPFGTLISRLCGSPVLQTDSLRATTRAASPSGRNS